MEFLLNWHTCIVLRRKDLLVQVTEKRDVSLTRQLEPAELKQRDLKCFHMSFGGSGIRDDTTLQSL